MSMFTAPGATENYTDTLQYYQDTVDSYLYGETPASDDQLQILKDEIQNSFELTVSEMDDLLSNFPANIRHTTIETMLPPTSTSSPLSPTSPSSLKSWYTKNMVIISIVQWVVILILLIRKSN